MAFVRVGRNLLDGMGLDYMITIFPIGGKGIWQCLSPRGDVKLSAALRLMDVWARMSSTTISYENYRFPPQIISHAVWLYFRFAVSLRLVGEMLLERGIFVLMK